MDWILNLFTNTESVAHIALLYAIVIAAGVYLGKIKFGGIALGVTFVLFAGIPYKSYRVAEVEPDKSRHNGVEVYNAEIFFRLFIEKNVVALSVVMGNFER